MNKKIIILMLMICLVFLISCDQNYNRDPFKQKLDSFMKNNSNNNEECVDFAPLLSAEISCNPGETKDTNFFKYYFTKDNTISLYYIALASYYTKYLIDINPVLEIEQSDLYYVEEGKSSICQVTDEIRIKREPVFIIKFNNTLEGNDYIFSSIKIHCSYSFINPDDITDKSILQDNNFLIYKEICERDREILNVFEFEIPFYMDKDGVVFASYDSFKSDYDYLHIFKESFEKRMIDTIKYYFNFYSKDEYQEIIKNQYLNILFNHYDDLIAFDLNDNFIYKSKNLNISCKMNDEMRQIAQKAITLLGEYEEGLTEKRLYLCYYWTFEGEPDLIQGTVYKLLYYIFEHGGITEAELKFEKSYLDRENAVCARIHYEELVESGPKLDYIPFNPYVSDRPREIIID